MIYVDGANYWQDSNIIYDEMVCSMRPGLDESLLKTLSDKTHFFSRSIPFDGVNNCQDMYLVRLTQRVKFCGHKFSFSLSLKDRKESTGV